MNSSFESVPFYCAMLLPKRIVVYLHAICVEASKKRAFIPSLTIIGVLLPMQALPTMHGSSTSTMATTTTTIRTTTIMSVVYARARE